MSTLYSDLPRSPGVYAFLGSNADILYIGKAKSLKDRVASYFVQSALLPKTRQLVSKIQKIDYLVVESEIDALILEANLIRRVRPKYNSEFRDDKSYPRIEISIKDKVPQVHLVRGEERPGHLYFGPYPIGSEVSQMLVFLRKVFPFVSQTHPGGRPCFRAHLGLCPCLVVFRSNLARRKYRGDIKKLVAFLSGKRVQLQRQLEKEMSRAAFELNFDRAAQIKDRLEKISWITAPRVSPFEYQLNPTLVADRREQEVNALARLLGLRDLSRIECYDVSHTSGKLATGSMVVFRDGSADKTQYRRFRLKFVTLPDDSAMIHEMIRRRFAHKDGWPDPSLIVVDGGAVQLSMARRAIAESNLTVPSIALAKREEEIYLDTNVKIKLPQDSPALRLVERIRDEAHRFSRKYHFLLRRKSLLS